MQRLFAIVLCLCVFVFVPAAYAAPAAAKGVPVLMYHYIRDCNCPTDKTGISLSVSPAAFLAQMHYLAEHDFTPISLATYMDHLQTNAPLPPKAILITFDDGYADLYTNAYPILQHFAFPAVSFLITQWVGHAGFLTWDQVQTMHESGLVSFQAHTQHHVYLPHESIPHAFTEMAYSKRDIEQALHTKVSFIAYPVGAHNKSVRLLARLAGFAGAFSTEYGYMQELSMDIPRVRIYGGISLTEFARRVEAAYTVK